MPPDLMRCIEQLPELGECTWQAITYTHSLSSVFAVFARCVLFLPHSVCDLHANHSLAFQWFKGCREGGYRSTLVSGGILPSILIVYMLHITQLCPNIVIPICLNVWAHSLASLFLCNFNSFDISMSMLRCSFIYHRFKITLIPCTIWTYVTSILPFVLLYLGRDLRLCQKRTAITTRLN